MGVGHTDPRIESHMGRQHMWGQWSSKGHFIGLLTFWLKFLKMVSNAFSCALDIIQRFSRAGPRGRGRE